MKVGIIGRKSSGRSTLFEGLTGQHRPIHGSEKTQLGIARILDPRVDRLSAICNPKKTVYAEITLALIPPPPVGPLNVKLMREMRDLKAYAHVIGAFSGEPIDEVVTEQVSELSTELVLADMERVDTRLVRIRKGGNARPGEELLLERAFGCLEKERPLRLESWDEPSERLIDELGLMSHRPLLTVVNVAEDLVSEAPSAVIEDAVEEQESRLMWLCANLEVELSSLDASEQRDFLAAYGLSEPISQRFVATAFSLLNQICFFTIGPDEVRAWPIHRQTNARKAARAIHSDLEKGFIRAEVVEYETLIEQGSEAKCKSAGLLRTEGKDYVVQDGDVINIRFNV